MKETYIYLDNAATSYPKPDEVHDKMSEFYRVYGVNPGRTGCDLALMAEEMIHETRKKLTALFNPSLVKAGVEKDPNRLVFTSNATHSLNIIIKGKVGPGDHVVSTMVEHNSVIRPINHLVKDGAEATFVKPDGEGYVDPDDVRKAIRKNTRLVIVNHCSNVIGVVQDIKAIGAVCKEGGVPLAVDAAQSAGHVPIDMAECNVSFLAFTGHKCLFGPTGTGGICVEDGAEVTATLWGGTGVKSAYPYHLEEYPYRLEAGTLNLMGIAGLSAGHDWIVSKGIENIHREEIGLLAVLQDGLREIRGVTIHGATRLDRRVAVCSITVKGYDPSDVGTLLDVEYNILTRTGLQCAPLIHDHLGTSPRGTVRFSIGPFNTREHIDSTIRAVREIASTRN
ncbi:MAG: aminotransferase class V-fold PLP-dependent enzyme [Acidobacteriota bacterium]